MDWQGPRIAGFIDGTYVQLSLPDWLRFGGNVERAVEENYSEYTYSYSVGEEVMEAEKRVALSPLAHRRNQPSTEPEQTGFHRLGRRGAQHLSSTQCHTDQVSERPAFPTPTPVSPPRKRRQRAGHRPGPGRKVQERRARAAQATGGSATRPGETTANTTPKGKTKGKREERLGKAERHTQRKGTRESTSRR